MTRFGLHPIESNCCQKKILLEMISVLDRVENIEVKGENAVYQYFLLFP